MVKRLPALAGACLEGDADGDADADAAGCAEDAELKHHVETGLDPVDPVDGGWIDYGKMAS